MDKSDCGLEEPVASDVKPPAAADGTDKSPPVAGRAVKSPPAAREADWLADRSRRSFWASLVTASE